MKVSTFNKIIPDFLEFLEIEKGRAAGTIVNYRRYLETFLAWMQDHTGGDGIPLTALDDTVLRKYRLWLNRKQTTGGVPIKRRTQNYYLIALRGLLRYCVRQDLHTLSPGRIELAKEGDRDIDVLTPHELQRLLDAPSGDEMASVRDRALLHALFSTGLRVSELVGLDCDDIDVERREFPVRGKGDIVRIVFLSDEAVSALEEWLEQRQDIDPALFIRIPPGKPPRWERFEDLRLSPRSVQRIIKKYAAAAGISKDHVTPHTLRHSFATDLLRSGADVRSVQALLGHANITTTQMYTHVTDRELRSIHEKFHGKSMNDE